MTHGFRNNLAGTFSAIAASKTAANDDIALSPQSIAMARAAVISEMSEVMSCQDSPVPHKLVIVAALADFATTDEAGLVRAQALGKMADYMLENAPAPVTQSISRFLIERLVTEPDVNIRQDVASYLGDTVVKNANGADKGDIVTALAMSARTDSEHDVRAGATQNLGRIVLGRAPGVDVLETTGVLADVAREDTNRYVRWGAAHLVKKILLSSVADQIPVEDLALRLTGTRPVEVSADIPGRIIATIEREALEDSEIKVAKKQERSRTPRL